MSVCIAIVVTSWCCALLARPRCPRLGNEVEELVYARLLGRQQTLILIATCVTAAAIIGMIFTLPHRVDPTLGEARRLNQYCAAAAARSSCYRMNNDGGWSEAVRVSNGQWTVIGTVTAPPTDAAPESGPNVEYSRGG
jgi:hypothetical protein